MSVESAPHKHLVTVDASFEPLIPKFMANRKQEVVRMQEALAVQDFDTIRKIAHGMKGAGGSYGFDRVTDLAAIIEHAAKTANAVSIQQELPQLDTYLQHVEIVYE